MISYRKILHIKKLSRMIDWQKCASRQREIRGRQQNNILLDLS